jgi:hypothetical protein
LQPGDKVLLERGSVFAGEVLHLKNCGDIAGAPIEIGAYGTGDALPCIAADGTGVWYQDYGTPLDFDGHVYRGEVSSAVLLYDVENIVLRDLEITNDAPFTDLESYCAADKMDRTGVAVVARDRGTLHSITLTGLFTSSKTLIIGPRGIEDIAEQQPAGDPAITITPEKIEQTAGKLGQTVEVATLHVSAKNMTQPTFFELAGKNADQFALSKTKIEKGSTETDIVITYTPTEVAVHRAYVLVTCPSIEDYDKSIAFSAYAIDEQNPPTITLNPQKLEKFEAKINEKSEQTIEVTTANMPDYTYVKVKDAGAFVLNNTMLIRNMTNTLKVTFQPKKEGTYSTSIVFSALGMDDVEVAIEGVATGETPDEPETVRIDPDCAEKLENARGRILNLIKEKRPRFVPAFELMTFRDNTISVSVPTTELREEILRSKTGMLMRIAELAGIEGMIELEVTVNEEIRAARPIKLEDRVRYITEKNPLVAELRKALDLEVE